jgi:hypothetical protein
MNAIPHNQFLSPKLFILDTALMLLLLMISHPHADICSYICQVQPSQLIQLSASAFCLEDFLVKRK